MIGGSLLVKYNKKIEEKYKDDKFLSRKFGSNTPKRLRKFIGDATLASNLNILRATNPGYDISKKQGTENTWKARLNHKWRVEFLIEKGEINISTIKEIEINSIHPHDY